MQTVYICFLVGGAIIPLISTILSIFDGHADFDGNIDTEITTDTDIGGVIDDVDVGIDSHIDCDCDLHTGGGGVVLGLFPTSLIALSAVSAFFGLVGTVMSASGYNRVLTIVVSIIVGYIAGVIAQTIIKSLKKIQVRNYGINTNEVLAYDGKVVDTILPGKLGTVSFTTLKGILVSYQAKCIDETKKIEAGKIVRVIELQGNVCIVDLKNKYE